MLRYTCRMFVKRRYVFYSCIFLSTLLIALIFFYHTKWSPKDVDFRIIVVTFSRSRSLRRLLESINSAHYYRNNVVIEIWIDRYENGTVDAGTVRVANDFHFDHGAVKVNIQPSHVGIQGQWITTWQSPLESQEIAVILEDDLTVSPYFYKYLKLVHRKYSDRPEINGFSLQGVSIKHDGKPGYVEVPRRHPVFLYPTIGTWGFSPNHYNWFKFVAWYLESRKLNKFKPIVPNHISSVWYKELEVKGRQDTIWSMWHIYYSWKNGLLTLYPNCYGKKGFSFNWKENGLHYTAQGIRNKDVARRGLIQTWMSAFDKLPDRPPVLNNSGDIISYLD